MVLKYRRWPTAYAVSTDHEMPEETAKLLLGTILQAFSDDPLTALIYLTECITLYERSRGNLTAVMLPLYNLLRACRASTTSKRYIIWENPNGTRSEIT